MDQVTFFFGGWAPILRIIVVGTTAYLALVAILRAAGPRTLAQMNAFDFIVTVALGASFGRILTARNVALAEAVTTFALLAALQYLISWFHVRSRWFARMVTTPPAILFYQGKFVRDTLRRTRITEAELCTALREQGIGSFEEVEAIVLESNGHFAVIKTQTVGDASALP